MAMQQKTLSNRSVAALEVERDTVFWDRDLTGFGIRVYPSGGKVYIAPGAAGRRDRSASRSAVTTCSTPTGPASGRRSSSRASRRGEDPVPLPLAAKAQRRTDGGRPRQAVSQRACRGAAQAEDAAAGPRHAEQPHPAGSRQNAIGGGRARPRCRVAPDAVPTGRPRRTGRSRSCPTCTGWARGGAWFRRGCNPCRSVEKYPERSRERFLTDAEFARLGRVLDEAGRERRRFAACRGGDPFADADRLPQERNPDPALVGRRSRRRRDSSR